MSAVVFVSYHGQLVGRTWHEARIEFVVRKLPHEAQAELPNNKLISNRDAAFNDPFREFIFGE